MAWHVSYRWLHRGLTLVSSRTTMPPAIPCFLALCLPRTPLRDLSSESLRVLQPCRFLVAGSSSGVPNSSSAFLFLFPFPFSAGWTREYESARPDPDDLLKQIDSDLLAFDEAKSKELARLLALHGTTDDDGYVMHQRSTLIS